MKPLLLGLLAVQGLLISGVGVAGPLPSRPECQTLWNLALAPENGTPERMQTDSYLFFQDGKIRYEHYNGSFDATRPHCLWSATKSVMASLTAQAVAEGKLQLDDRLGSFFKATSASQADISVQNLLQMSSGIEWHESAGVSIQDASAPRMLYGPGAQDHLSYVLSLPMGQAAPGKKWNYSTGDTLLLSAILGQVYPHSRFPWRLLFDPLQMHHATIERDPVGTYVGAAYGFLNTRDLLKFGRLYLNGGVWRGHRLLSQDWVAQVQKLSPALLNPETTSTAIIENGVYGTGFWLNQAIPSKNVPTPFPHSPPDMYFAAGHYGQLVIIIPSQKTVIVRTGHDAGYWDKIDSLVDLSLRCFKP